MKKYLVIFEEENNSFSAYVPALPGCIATGKTREEVEELIYEGIKFHLEGLKRDDLIIPENKIDSEIMVFG